MNPCLWCAGMNNLLHKLPPVLGADGLKVLKWISKKAIQKNNRFKEPVFYCKNIP